MVPGLNYFLWHVVSAVAERGRYKLRITSRSVQSWPLGSEPVSDLVWSRGMIDLTCIGKQRVVHVGGCP